MVTQTSSWVTGSVFFCSFGLGFCAALEPSFFFLVVPFLADDTLVVAGFFFLAAVVVVFGLGLGAFLLLLAGGKGGLLPVDTMPALL